MTTKTARVQDVLSINCAVETERIAGAIRQQVGRECRKKGAVLGLSGGVDSSVVGALCVRALGQDRVFGLMMPEQDSSADTRQLSELIVEHLGIPHAEEDITALLEAAGCYRRRDEAIRQVVPEYGEGYTCKLVLPSVIASEQYRIYSIVVRSPDGKETKKRLSPKSYLGVVAATNFKQRTRKMLEYYHADRLNYAVAGTPNLLEYDQGFFVKNGDGEADFKPIAHLYKTQVYQLAEYLEIPTAIRSRPPTTDTYSMPQSQEEFFFSLTYDKMDLCLYGHDHHHAPDAIADALGLTPVQVERVYRDIERKRQTNRYLHLHPILVEPVEQEER